MAETEIVIYQEAPDDVPLLDWLDQLPMDAINKCQVEIERLAERGHQLRRPDCEYLQESVYELRAPKRGIQYRILYAFCGKNLVVLTHGFTIDSSISKATRVDGPIPYT